MAMTVTNEQLVGNIEKIRASWTSDGSGAQSQSINIYGVILRVVTDPGSAAPTDNYGVTLTDANNIDLFASQGANRDTSNSEHFCPGLAFTDGTTTSVMPISHYGAATLAVANAGDSKTGEVVIYVKKADPPR
jgi:hypothetical protein